MESTKIRAGVRSCTFLFLFKQNKDAKKKKKKTSLNLFSHGAPKSSLETLFKGALAFLVELEFGDVGFCGERKTGVTREKPSEQR